MLKIIIYGYINKFYLSRDIEKACLGDINFMFLLEDSPAPDHAAFARFRSLHFDPYAEKIRRDRICLQHIGGKNNTNLTKETVDSVTRTL